MNNRVRLHSLIWVIVISIGFYSVQGGILGIVTGGVHHLQGPPKTNITDNNQLALAMVIVIPLMNYLRMQSANTAVRYAILGCIALSAVGVLTTYSRGGFIGLVTILLYSWFKSKRKIVTLIILSLITIPAIQLMPGKWFSRIDTIDNAEEDSSFQGRIDAWEVSLNLALKRPFLGGGFSAIESYDVTMRYKSPDQELSRGRAAHSIYFQVLGDLGFVGLFVFLIYLSIGWLEGRSVIRLTMNQPTLKWASDMANMIHVSLIGFMVSGAALSVAYFDIALIQVAISSMLHRVVIKSLQTEPGTVKNPIQYQV